MVSGFLAADVLSRVGHASLMHGTIPVAAQGLTLVALSYAIGRPRRDAGRRWWIYRVPLAAVAGATTAAATYWIYGSLGLASEPAPWSMWMWVALVGSAIAIAILGWHGAGWWRRNILVFAASFSLLCTGLTINSWLGYFPTVHGAWSQLTNRPLPHQVDLGSASAMRHTGVLPRSGALVPVRTGDQFSGFRHRGEWVYLPPAWFAGTELPAVLMVGGEFNTPADWVRVGEAVTTLDSFARAHGGNAPMAVFADATGGFTADTECVNGPRGNAADHLTAEVVPEVERLFSVPGRTKWGVVGFSSGGTCAVDLAVMHPGTFSAFIDIGGDRGPNAGTRSQTIDRLFGGDADAWAWFDPATAIARHGRYADSAGLFAVPGALDTDGDSDGRGGVGQGAAEELCALGAARGIACKLVALPGRHDWPSAAEAFAATLPWLAGRLASPAAPVIPMP